MSDIYNLPNGTLKNKLGIVDSKELEDAERSLSSVRSIEFKMNPIKGSFNQEHLKSIHGYIFQDIYEWAGQERIVDIAKADMFCRTIFLNDFSQEIFENLKKENFFIDSTKPIDRIADFFADLNALHPFREGNGRTQRMFVEMLCNINGYEVNWEGISQEKMAKESIRSLRYDNEGLKEILYSCTTPIPIKEQVEYIDKFCSNRVANKLKEIISEEERGHER